MTYKIDVLPVAVKDAPDAHSVVFHVKTQTFHIGPDYFSSKDDADWFARQFGIAMEAVATGREPVATPTAPD